MPCYKLKGAHKTKTGQIVFHAGQGTTPIDIPCGQCIGCRIDRTRDWSVRALHEAQMHQDNCVVTLTYREDALPFGGYLHYPDFKLFIRKLRKRVPVRFFMCGEYGEKFERPHYHAILFGINFADRKQLKKTKAGTAIYTSELLSSLWTHGFAHLADFEPSAARYIAGYIMKKVVGSKARAHYEHVANGGSYVPEFGRMSLKPGIGYKWFEKFGHTDAYPHDQCVMDGQLVPVPRFYNRKLKETDSIGFALLKAQRERKFAEKIPDTFPARLIVREKVARARLSLKSRSLEKSP